MSTWRDQDSAAITNWISKLPTRSDEHSATLLSTANEKLCNASTSTYRPRSIPLLANSISSPGSEGVSIRSRKRKRSDIEQDHLKQAPKRTHQQNKHLTAEHREEEHLLAAYLGTGHIVAGNAVPDFQAEQFESRHHEEYFGVEQSEPEYFKMDEDGASITGSNPSLISNRPILEAKPPSRRSSRSTSPIRLTLVLLRSAVPPIDICQPGPAAATSPGEAVNKLKGFLLDGYDKAFIPRKFEARLRKIAPDEAIVLHEAMFHDHHEHTTEELDSLWDDIQDVYYEANACSNLLKDENAWVQVVRSVLRLAGMHSLSKDLELNSVQSQSIEPRYLPTLPSSPTSLSKKADLALVISPPRHSDSTINQWRKLNPGVGLSHMSDAYTRETLLVCPLEVKRQGGDYNEAVCQLAVWSAAALEKLRILASMGRDKEMLEGFPYPGWTVVGHEWQLHISWKEDSGKVIVFGPYLLLSAKVNSYLDIFRLLRLFSKLKQWLLKDYKSWVHEHVLGPRYREITGTTLDEFHRRLLSQTFYRRCAVDLWFTGYCYAYPRCFRQHHLSKQSRQTFNNIKNHTNYKLITSKYVEVPDTISFAGEGEVYHR